MPFRSDRSIGRISNAIGGGHDEGGETDVWAGHGGRSAHLDHVLLTSSGLVGCQVAALPSRPEEVVVASVGEDERSLLSARRGGIVREVDRRPRRSEKVRVHRGLVEIVPETAKIQIVFVACLDKIWIDAVVG